MFDMEDTFVLGSKNYKEFFLLIREQNVKNVVNSIKHLMNFVVCMTVEIMKNVKFVDAICTEHLAVLPVLEPIIEF